MGKEKQIEEMECVILRHTYDNELVSLIATELFNAGYRKATEVVAEIFAEIERLLSANMSGELCSDGLEWFDYYEIHLAEDIAELKKKFTEDNNG